MTTPLSSAPYDRLASIEALHPHIHQLGLLLQRRDIALEVSSDQKLAPGMVSEILAQLDMIDVSSHISTQICGAAENYIGTARLVLFNQDETIFHESDNALTYFVLIHGTVELVNSDTTIYQVLSAPSGFGNDRLAEETPGYRLHTARAASAVVCLVSNQDTFACFMTAGSACATHRKLLWIKSSPLFRRWSDDNQLILAKALRTHPNIATGRFLVQPGELITGVWFIIAGKLKIGTTVQQSVGSFGNQKSVDLALIGAGDLFGCELLEERGRSRWFASVHQDAELLFLPAEQARSLLLSDPRTKLILERLAKNRRLWDEHMIQQARAYESVDIAVNNNSMKICKYQLADILASNADSTASRRRRSSMSEFSRSGSLRQPPPKPAEIRRPSVNVLSRDDSLRQPPPKPAAIQRPSVNVLSRDDSLRQPQKPAAIKSRRSSLSPRSKIMDSDECKMPSADTNAAHDISALSEAAQTDGPTANTSTSPKSPAKSKTQLIQAMQQLESVLNDETTQSPTTTPKPTLEMRSGRHQNFAQAATLPPVSSDHDSSLHDANIIATKSPKKVSHADWLARYDKLGNYPILVVDDSKTTLSVLKWAFKKQGCQVDLATDGLQALELMQRQLYMLVVCDILMPHMDGITAVTKLREWETVHRPDEMQPILLLTKADETPVPFNMSESQLIGMRHKSHNQKDFRVLLAACFCDQQDGSTTSLVHTALSPS